MRWFEELLPLRKSGTKKEEEKGMRQQVLVDRVRAKLKKMEGVTIKAPVAEINVILTKIIDLDVK